MNENPSPERNTEKLVEAARWYVECRERYFRNEPVAGLNEAWEGLRQALAEYYSTTKEQ